MRSRSSQPIRIGARRLGAAGRQRALERFTAAAMARAFEQLYREL